MAFPGDLHRIDPSLGLSAEQAATLCIKYGRRKNSIFPSVFVFFFLLLPFFLLS